MEPQDPTRFRRGANDASDASAKLAHERSVEVAPTGLGVWGLAWPTIVGFSAQTLVRFADFAMVGPLGPEALAAVGLGGQVYWLVQAIANLAPAGLAAIMARAVGAGDPELADRVLRQSIMLGAILGAITTAIGLPLTRQAIAIYGVEPGVVSLGSDYLYWLLWGTLPFSLSFVFGAALRAAGDVRIPLYIGLLTNAVNVLLNWILIYGKLGAPALGVAGASIASSIAMTLQVAIFGWMWTSRRLVLIPISGSWRLDRDLIRRIHTIGYPAAVEQMLFQIGLLVFQRIMSLYGTAAIAAYNVGAQILSFSFIPGVGFATAAATLMGQNLGRGDPEAAARSTRRSAAGAVVSMSAMGLLVILFAQPLAAFFSDDPDVRGKTVDFIRILGLAQPLMAVEFAIGGGLRGAGDTFYPMVISFIGLFVVRLIPAAIAGVVFSAPLTLVWCALIGDYAVKALMLISRYHRGQWRTLEV